jgi:hypothetical protein
VMAIADIFEALTAADRPYKAPKTLSEALKIMRFMVKDRHIDPDLFRLFVASGVYQEYARQHLTPEQIDEVDVAMILDQIGGHTADSDDKTVSLAHLPIRPIPSAPSDLHLTPASPGGVHPPDVVPRIDEVDARV